MSYKAYCLTFHRTGTHPVIDRCAGPALEPAPFVLQTSLDDFYVSYELNGYTDQPAKMSSIYSELHQNIQDSFNASGVEIMSPHYSAVRDGNKSAVPDEYLPRSYQAPAFRIFPFGGKASPEKNESDPKD